MTGSRVCAVVGGDGWVEEVFWLASDYGVRNRGDAEVAENDAEGVAVVMGGRVGAVRGQATVDRVTEGY